MNKTLKELTRCYKRIFKDNLYNFIASHDISDDLKAELKQISPFNYTGINPLDAG